MFYQETMASQQELWNEEYAHAADKWNKETKDLLPLLKDKVVLELGVGNGKTLHTILRQKPKRVIAIDYAQNAIDICSKKFEKEGNVFLMKADILNLPLGELEFDVIVCYYVLNALLAEERDRAINEIFSVLKHKGIVLFEDFAIGDMREIEQEAYTQEKHTTKKVNGLLCHYFDVDEIKKLFKGFTPVSCELKISNPIHNKPEFTRKIIQATFEK